MKKLIFIYKAKSDKISKLINFAHKIISPSTYACDLCSLTYGDFSIKREWKEYLDKLNEKGIQTEFHYEERAIQQGMTPESLPAVLCELDGTRTTVVAGKEFEAIERLHDLQHCIDTFLG
ncbi:MAG TPA: hypothetical protein PK048_04205 [Candidatus Absconditabacterales bacterium]|nr:hypothetical protein [Candidatus Absconditabacterales bacterium]